MVLARFLRLLRRLPKLHALCLAERFLLAPSRLSRLIGFDDGCIVAFLVDEFERAVFHVAPTGTCPEKVNLILLPVGFGGSYPWFCYNPSNPRSDNEVAHHELLQRSLSPAEL